MRSAFPRLALAFAVAAAAAPSSAQPTARIGVTDIKPLLRGAIEHGAAHGVLTGEPAAYVRQRFGTRAPIEIDVKSLHPLPQAGCHRLEVTTRQRDVLEGGKRADKQLVYQVSYCRNGTFPKRGAGE
jgi:hypothetical protein